MSKPNQNPICPYLGLPADRDSRFSYPEAAHCCYVTGRKKSISLDHQSAFCLSSDYPTCPRFVELPADLLSGATSTSIPGGKPQNVNTQAVRLPIKWGLAGLLIGLLIIFAVFYVTSLPRPEPISNSVEQIVPHIIATSTAIPVINEPVVEDTPTPVAAGFLATPTATSTPLSGVQIYKLSPVKSDVGWVTSGEERGHHFGDSYLYAGYFEGQTYHGAFRIDLSSIPRGAPIYSAQIQLTGLREDRLGVRIDQRDAEGVWILRLLDSEIDLNWHKHNFQEIFNAPVLQSLQPFLEDRDLAAGKTNTFELTEEQIRILETRIVENEYPTVSFRLDGPLTGPDNLFAWDTGVGSASEGNPVTLLLEVGPPPATPPAYDYVVVTSTSAPENVLTAAAMVLEATAEATRVGTATALPPNMVTATPIPEYLIITDTPVPGNEVTVQAISDIATAEALTTGTPTPLPTNVMTATPTGTPTSTPTLVPIQYVIITDTPTAESIYAAATQSALATAQVLKFGTSTPLPANWVTPVVVTSTPVPGNDATALAMAELATAIAFTTGTPAPTLANVVTATPTPVFEAISLIYTPTPVVPAPTPQPLPPVLLGKILFLSDREGADAENVYMYDPETGELGRLTDRWPYDVAMVRETWSADERFRAFTKDALRYARVGTGTSERDVRNDAPALYVHDGLYDVETQITTFAIGIAYGGVWSPAEPRIAFVSNDTADDEIWTVRYDGTDLKRLTNTNEAFNGAEIGKDTFVPELSKSPTWSPDGKQIVFMSNRTKNQQLWIMNADGSDQRLLMGWDNWTPYNDWAPVWIKFLEPAPEE